MDTLPKLPIRLLRWFCKVEYLEEIEGDLVELYELRAATSVKKARRRLFWDVICSFRPTNIKSFPLTNPVMNTLYNYTKVYFRRFRKDLAHYAVNTLGLALGFVVLFFILLYVSDEQNLDAHHSKSSRIYRVLEKRTSDEGQVQHFSSTANPLGPALKAEFPEVEEAARMIYLGSGALKYGENQFSDRNYAFAEKSIFQILDFNVVAGDPLQSFGGEVAIALNQSTARKLFGDQDPVGKLVDMPGKLSDVEVIAVYEDLPYTSTYQFNTIYIFRFEKFPQNFSGWFASWDSRGMTTWVLMKENTRPADVLAKKAPFMEKYFAEDVRGYHDFYFQSITDMHLGSSHLDHYGTEPLPTIAYGDRSFVSIILLIGVFVMVIAGLNYINLSSVQSLKRSLEAGIRKVNGANATQLKVQLFYESFITLLIAYGISLALVVALHPFFLELAQKSIPVADAFRMEILGYHAVIFVAIWVISAIIPALYYASANRSLVLVKNVFVGKGEVLRRSFVVVQYGISICLIVGSIVLYRQLEFVQSKDLGFSRDQLLTLDINSGAARAKATQIIAALKSSANVVNASTSSRVPGEWKYIPSAGLSVDRTHEPVMATHYAADQNWLDTYGMTLSKGRNFSGSDAADTLKVLLNEKAVEMLGLENPVGQTLWVSEDTVSKMTVIGVVKNFHFESLHKPLGPVVITSCNNPVLGIDYFTVKYSQNTAEVIAHMEEVQKQFDPETPAEVNFLDERWERYYKADQARSSLILVATIISIIISTFGLFGLVNFTAERKTKEIGIRKVMGATVAEIMSIVLKDYLVLLLVALLLATPLAWWMLERWLADFAYRIDLSIFTFAFAFVAVLLVSFVTVFARVFRLARLNPVVSLRYE
ncbi:ABC transporter permease [Marinoscillum furvescens]|uniref:Putative ABC transport system permease protein n=1 Tax=Marinoscillum furvescens DSM 4134 TaxID=1122208 RepID=A0A3D9L3F4_MARFU|nr:ABC transporter permease [Marinoscillum furvescens]RED99773.1 putative ABC transport system permease protein [Marinoscillum furvescens DSM 4134]